MIKLLFSDMVSGDEKQKFLSDMLKYDPEIHTPTIFLNPYRQVSLFTAPDRDRDPSISPPIILFRLIMNADTI